MKTVVVISRRWTFSGGCCAIVVMCEWQEFKELPLPQLASVMKGKVLLDAKNVLDRRSVEQSGLTYLGMGR